MSDIDTFRATSQQGRGCHVEFHVGQSVAQREISSTRLCRIAPFERPNVCGDRDRTPRYRSLRCHKRRRCFVMGNGFLPLSPVCAHSVVHVLDHAGDPFWGQTIETRDNHAGRSCTCQQRVHGNEVNGPAVALLGTVAAAVDGRPNSRSGTCVEHQARVARRSAVVIAGWALPWCSNGRHHSTQARQHPDRISSPHSLPQNGMVTCGSAAFCNL
jgi:hypothetical protein